MLCDNVILLGIAARGRDRRIFAITIAPRVFFTVTLGSRSIDVEDVIIHSGFPSEHSEYYIQTQRLSSLREIFSES